jgi:hypothetical protein
VTKTEVASKRKRSKHEYLSDAETKLLDELNGFFEVKVKVKRIRNGENQTIETLINEEALLFAKYLRRGISEWKPRSPNYFSFRFAIKKL